MCGQFMEQDEIRHFFGEILKENRYISSESMAVFGKLIRLTLQFRDSYFESHAEILTVEETRRGLDVYQNAVGSGRLPEKLSPKIAGLVKLWLKEINGIKL
ncbi:hypothetical protein TRIP_C90024 [Candidatus Zixiibacteriota bacterium]|nr:hypothetical protein TRIP_C90024 [candidate division Zixibacteria bacterium]